MEPADLVVCILVSQYVRTRWEVRRAALPIWPLNTTASEL